jgi:formate--tetrahydrofolate ligase
VVTEAGFGADLGAEKFVDIKCRAAGLEPQCAVVVATVRALKMHGGVAFENLKGKDVAAVQRGMPNLRRHLENIAKFALPCVVAVNRFPADDPEELACVQRECEKLGVEAVLATHYSEGSSGAEALARSVVRLCEGAKTKVRACPPALSHAPALGLAACRSSSCTPMRWSWSTRCAPWRGRFTARRTWCLSRPP